MKQFLTILAILFISLHAKSQLTKGHWLVGGTGSFSSTKNTYSNNNYYQTSDVTDIKISPNIGYFVVDKFAVGLRPSYSKNKAEVTTTGGLSTNVNRFEIGPFVRYYFLSDENRYHILADASYHMAFTSLNLTKETSTPSL